MDKLCEGGSDDPGAKLSGVDSRLDNREGVDNDDCCNNLSAAAAAVLPPSLWILLCSMIHLFDQHIIIIAADI